MTKKESLQDLLLRRPQEMLSRLKWKGQPWGGARCLLGGGGGGGGWQRAWVWVQIAEGIASGRERR